LHSITKSSAAKISMKLACTTIILLFQASFGFAPSRWRDSVRGKYRASTSETDISTDVEVVEVEQSPEDIEREISEAKALYPEMYEGPDPETIWPGDRPPVSNPQIYLQSMDATWGRGKFRTEVWDDKPNPINDWWEAFTPSEEEIAADKLGYDFADPKGYFEVAS